MIFRFLCSVLLLLLLLQMTNLSCHKRSFKDRLQKLQCQYTNRATKSRYNYKLYDTLNRWVFRCFFRTGSVLAEVTSVGKLFQRRGVATPKARCPAVDRRDRRTISLFVCMVMFSLHLWVNVICYYCGQTILVFHTGYAVSLTLHIICYLNMSFKQPQ